MTVVIRKNVGKNNLGHFRKKKNSTRITVVKNTDIFTRERERETVVTVRTYVARYSLHKQIRKLGIARKQENVCVQKKYTKTLILTAAEKN